MRRHDLSRNAATKLLLTTCFALGSTDSQAANPVGPSFDCAKAIHRVERMVCSDEMLADLDRQLDLQYRALLRLKHDHEQRRSLQFDQQNWLSKQRNTCQNTACLADQYQDRLEQINNEILYLNKPAQFR
jgi:uncharacterized protein